MNTIDQQAKGRTLHVWIMGASSGIGLALAEQLLPTARCTLSARTLQPLLTLQTRFPANAFAVECDVQSSCAIESAHVQATNNFGSVDVLVNVSGIARFGNCHEEAPQVTTAQLATNLSGAIACIQAVLPSMIQQQSGMILTVNSVAAIKTFAGGATYAASKAGLLAYTRCVRAEVRSFGIKVIDVLVGATETPIWSAEMLAEYGHRMMRANDVADTLHQCILQKSNPRTHWEELVLRPQLGDL
jgi:short-subunit dehydrogenase